MSNYSIPPRIEKKEPSADQLREIEKLSQFLNSDRSKVDPGGRATPPSAAVGSSLSTYHISRKGRVISYSEGAVFEVKKPRLKAVYQARNTAKRGIVKGFTVSSRRRLMRMIGKTNKQNLGIFVTLTYPETFPAESKIYKRHLDNFLKRLVYHFPGVSGVWKLEPQNRGAPHYHLIVWGAKYSDLLTFVPDAWYRVVGSGDEKHLLWHQGLLGNGNVHCCQKVESWRGVMSYCGKYLGKVVLHMPGWESVGRYWGIFHRSAVPWSTIDIRECTYQEACNFMRYMCRYAHLKKRDYKSLSIYVENPAFWVQKLC